MLKMFRFLGSKFARGFAFLRELLNKAAVAALGKVDWSWNKPKWIEYIGGKISPNYQRAKGFSLQWIASHRILFGTTVALLLVSAGGGIAGYQWYKRQPKPHFVGVTIIPPGLTKIEAKPMPLPLRIVFSESASNIQAVRNVKEKIRVTPEIEGTWRWDGDRELIFFPENDWPIDQAYRIKLNKELFASAVKLESYDLDFRTKTFTASVYQSIFYQNPLDPKEKKVVVSIRFSHPVDSEDLKKRINLTLSSASTDMFGKNNAKLGFNLLLGALNSEAYIHSENITLPERDSTVQVKVDSGFHALKGGNAISQALEAAIQIPGRFNFFQITETSIDLVPNEKMESDQILSVSTSTDVGETEFRSGLQALLLPKSKNPYEGSTIDPEVLARAKPLPLELVPNERDSATSYHFKFKADENRQIYLKIKKGMKASSDYILGSDFETTLTVPPFPAEVKLMHSGAILSFQGEKRISVYARGVPAIKYKIGRVLPAAINHFLTQTDGNFRRPHFQNYNFNEQNITEQFEKIEKLSSNLNKNQYVGLDLGEYLGGVGTSGKRGLFFIKAHGWDPANKAEMGRFDQRFILVTDLGLIVKEQFDHSRLVFVQSFKSGNPVANVKIDVIAKNGTILVSKTTGIDGKVDLPPLNDFTDEKFPVGILASREADLSFLSLTSMDRRVDASRFDIGGVGTTVDGNELSAFVFSDRGLYRPGDECRGGIIIRDQKWEKQLAGIPLALKVTDARGLEILNRLFTVTSDGFSEFKFKTEETSPTGQYQVSVFLVDDVKKTQTLLGSTSVRVEEFLPDTMKITSKFSKESLEGWVDPKDLSGKVSLRNLFGTPAENRRVTGQLKLTPAFPSFKRFPGYHFYDSLRARQSFHEQLEEQTTNVEGDAEFNLSLERFEKGTYEVNFIAEGFAAEGGRSVTAESTVMVSPLEYILGYKSDGDLSYIKKGSERGVHLIGVNRDLKKIAAKDLSLEILESRNLAVLVKKDNGTYEYESVQKLISTLHKSLHLPAAGTQFALPTDKPGDYTVVVKGVGEVELLKFNFSVIGASNRFKKLEKNSELQVKLSKKDFRAGEEVELQITSPYVGSGLITIEREKVFASKWFKASATNSIQKITVPSGIEGGAYVNVTFSRAIDSNEIFTNPFSNGIVPFSINLENRKNQVTLAAPSLVKPGQNIEVEYQTQAPSKLVIFGIDEGILQVAGYHTPDPMGHFFKKRALEVTTDQLLDLILPEYSLMKKVSPSGGDEGMKAIGANLNPFKRKQNKPVAFWSGILDGTPEKKKLSLQIPDYFNGTVHFFAVSVAPNLLGVTDSKMLVRGDFVLTPSVPTFVAPNDEFIVGLSVSNNLESSGPQALLSLDIEGSEHFKVQGPARQSLTIPEGRESSTSFKVKVQEALGEGILHFTASLGEKTQKVTHTISVRPAFPYRTELLSGILKSGEKILKTDRETYPHFEQRFASVSTVPLSLSFGLIQYLNEYPYGCTEQIISKAFPLVSLRGRPEFVKETSDHETKVDSVVQTLRTRQGAQGGFGVWDGRSEASSFHSVYAYHFLIEAKERNYSVPKEMLTRDEGYLKAMLMRDPNSIGDARIWAYSLYLLARNGIVLGNELVALRKVLDNRFPKIWTADITAAFLAATYRLYRQEDQALSLMQNLKLAPNTSQDFSFFDYSLFNESAYIYLVAKHFPEFTAAVSAERLEQVVQRIVDGQYNTLSSAFAVLALDSYATRTGLPAAIGALKLFEQASSSDWTPIQLDSGLFAKATFGHAAQKIKVSNESQSPVFYQVTQAGFDLKAPKEVKQGLEISREIVDEGGKAITTALLGKEYEVHVRVRAIGKPLSDIAIVDLLPGGFETVLKRDSVDTGDGAQNPSASPESEEGEPVSRVQPDEGEGSETPPEEAPSEDSSWNDSNGNWFKKLFSLTPAFAEDRSPASRLKGSESSWVPDYTDIREDRVVLYGSISSSISEFIYRVKGTVQGTFQVPPIFAESMYDRSIQALSPGGTIRVEKK